MIWFLTGWAMGVLTVPLALMELTNKYPNVSILALIAFGFAAIWADDWYRRWKHLRTISVAGVDYYLIRHGSISGDYIIATDVTITNRRSDPVSVGAEYIIDESLDYIDKNGETKTYRHKNSCAPTTEAISGWEGNNYYKPNKPIEFPLNLAPGETRRGYIAFAVGRESAELSKQQTNNVIVDRERGMLRIFDYVAMETLKGARKKPELFLGSFKARPLVSRTVQ